MRTLLITSCIMTMLTFCACSDSKKDHNENQHEKVGDATETSPNNIEEHKNMDIKTFKENWGTTKIPSELEKLIDFQNNVSSAEFYAQGFAVTIDDKLGLKSWSEDPAFLERLHPFAQANGTGSFYAIWNDGTTKPINEMPIVVFGDEGGTHIVAEDMLQFLQLLSADTEISVEFDEAYFYQDEHHDESRDRKKYVQWLKNEYDIDQASDPDSIIKTAQNRYKKDFDQWFERYYKIG